MLRRPVSGGLAILAILAVALTAVAAQAEPAEPGPRGAEPSLPAGAGRRVVVPTPVEHFATPHAPVSRTIYLERCVGGCVIRGGTNDARTLTSTIPQGTCQGGSCPLGEYRNGDGETGAAADAEWAALVQCMREVYSPFDVAVTDVKPSDGTSYHAAVIAGIPQELRLGADVLGIAPLASDCSAQDNVVSFSFANAHMQTELVSRVQNLCWTAAQESAHAFGLDHQYAFLADSRSACNDPMTYRIDCGGQKFFRNESASCGEHLARPCKCGASQNSHRKLRSVFGEGVSLIPSPSVQITTPVPGTTELGTVVGAIAGSRRGVSRVQLRLNGYPWVEARGAAFGSNGQPDPATYALRVPGDVPNSIIDVQVRAYDDLGNYTDSAVVTVTKGGPCTSAEGCAPHQKCEAGKCFWDPPAGELGDACTYPQFCVSGLCQGTADQPICTQPCALDDEEGCPSDFSCVQTSPGRGVCFFAEDTGCCSVSKPGGAPWAHLAFAAFILTSVVRPWRRKRA